MISLAYHSRTSRFTDHYNLSVQGGEPFDYAVLGQHLLLGLQLISYHIRRAKVNSHRNGYIS